MILDDISQILSSGGEVPNLFTQEEKNKIIDSHPAIGRKSPGQQASQDEKVDENDHGNDPK